MQTIASLSLFRRLVSLVLGMAGPWLLAVQCLAGPSGPVTWGQTVNVNGGGWGRMVQLTNGHWLAVSTIFPAGTNSQLRLLRSADQCRTWTPVATLVEPGRTLDNGELVVRPDGSVLLSMRSLIDGASYKLPVYRSTNSGTSWTFLSNIDTSEGLGSRGLWEPDLWVLGDGRLLVTYSNEKHDGYSQVISGKVSTDGGATWGDEFRAVEQPGGGNLRPGMSQVARMADGRYILVYEVVNSGNADVHYKLSTNGVAWPTGLGTRIPGQHCGPFVTALPDGRLFLTSCENEVSFSEDFGETWQRIEPPAWPVGHVFTWPAIYATKTNELAVMAVSPSLKLRFGALAPPRIWPNPFLDDFNDGDDADWTRYGGGFGLVSGSYALSNFSAYGKALTGDGFWSDGTLAADVMLTTPSGDAGLLFRATNPDRVGPDDVFGYYVGLHPVGQVFLGRMSNSWTHLAFTNTPVPLNTWIRLRVEMAGPELKIFVNDDPAPKIAWTDATFRRGQIGVRTFMGNARFDNVAFTNAAPLRLDLKRNGAQVDLSWPRSAFQTLRLHEANTLNDDMAWQPVTNVPTLLGDRWQVPLPQSAHGRFFQLRSP